MVDVPIQTRERDFVIPAIAARVVGPGRRERGYLERVAELEQSLAEREVELDVSTRLERGCQRMLDRLERQSDADRAQVGALQQQQKQLILALGAAQREVEMLRGQLQLAAEAPKQLAPARRGWLSRLLART
jgi:hypothetical protein